MIDTPAAIFASIASYKGRTIDLDQPVRVYRNLTSKTYSIKQGGRVVGHSVRVMLRDARMLVNENGRQRVIATRKKEVHALVEGMLAIGGACGTHLRYNPYVAGYFHETVSGKPVHRASAVLLNDNPTYCS